MTTLKLKLLMITEDLFWWWAGEIASDLLDFWTNFVGHKKTGHFVYLFYQRPSVQGATCLAETELLNNWDKNKYFFAQSGGQWQAASQPVSAFRANDMFPRYGPCMFRNSFSDLAKNERLKVEPSICLKQTKDGKAGWKDGCQRVPQRVKNINGKRVQDIQFHQIK